MAVELKPWMRRARVALKEREIEGSDFEDRVAAEIAMAASVTDMAR